jgi:hypothetical protein
LCLPLIALPFLNLPVRPENKNLLFVWPSIYFSHLTVLPEG